MPHQQIPQISSSQVSPSQASPSTLPPYSSHRPALFPDLDDEPNSASSSESDDDENDALNTSRGSVPVRGSRLNDDANTPLDAARRSNSALSLESLQNDSEGGEDEVGEEVQCDQNGQEENDAEISKRAGEQVPMEDAIEPDTKRIRLESDSHTATQGADDDDVVFVSMQKRAESNQTESGAGNHGRDEKGSIMKIEGADGGAPRGCEMENGQMNVSNIDNLDQQGRELVATGPTNVPVGREDGRYLVNIAPVSADDGSGWDRFVFFSFRSQRFGFISKTYLSTFSPFAAVASGMEGVTSKSVCAVCGSGGRLLSCLRCPLAFHQHCIDPLGRTLSETWFCRACKAVKGQDLSIGWDPEVPPPELPSPVTGFARLTADANEGNPLDFVFNPTLFNYYRKECGGDWLRCRKCRRIRIADDGVLTESVHVPFECSYAFWLPDELRTCESPLSADPNLETVKKVEAYIANRSRRRNALFFYGFAEEDRTDFGFPQLETQGAVDDSVIVIEDDACDAPPADMNPMDLGNPSTNMNGPGEKMENVLGKQILSKETDARHSNSAEQSRGLIDSSSETRKVANAPVPVRADETALAQDSYDAATVSVQLSTSNMAERREQYKSARLGGSGTDNRKSCEVSRATVSDDPERRRQTSDRASLAAEMEVAGDALPAATPVAEIARIAVGSRPHSELGKDIRVEDKREEEPIDKTLARGSQVDDDLLEQILEYIATLDLDTNLEDCLTDMALEGDKSLMRLYKVYHRNDNKFKRHASRLASKRMGRDTAGVAS